jgi:hypothetical protein
MSKGSAPAAPNYAAAATTQGEQTQALNAQQTAANRPDVSTPWGSLGYTTSASIDPATGTPVTDYNESVNLTPQEQQSVTNQQNIQAGTSGIASNLLNTVGSQINAAPGQVAPTQQMTGAGVGVNTNPEMLDQATTNATYQQFQNMEQPLQQQQTLAQNAQLEAQGLRPGDQAYDTANTNLLNTQFTQDQTAQDQALLAGEQEGSTLFGEQNSAQAQDFGQEGTQTQYNNSLIPQGISNQEAELGLGQEQSGYDLNLLNSLMNGEQVSMPSFPGTTSAGSGQAANLLQAAEDTGQSDLNTYNAQTSSSNATLGALGGLASDAALYAALA